MKDIQLNTALLEWSSTFIRLSLQDFNRYTRQTRLSLAHMTVLMHLHYRGPSEVTHFCDMMQITAAGASQMIEKMVKQGMVERTQKPGDRRVRLVQLTERGREIVQESIAAREAWVAELTGMLEDSEREEIKRALAALTSRARELETRIAARSG